MHHQEFAISRLIREVINDSGLDYTEFVGVLGYRNRNKGLRRLESWLETGSGDAEFLKRIASQFGLCSSKIEQSLIKTVSQLSNDY